MTTAPDESPWELARTCREALNQEIYSGAAPHDSTALSEAWPTAAGAGFTISHHNHLYAVIVVPVAAAGDLIRPDYSAWDDQQ